MYVFLHAFLGSGKSLQPACVHVGHQIDLTPLEPFNVVLIRSIDTNSIGQTLMRRCIHLVINTDVCTPSRNPQQHVT